MIANDEIQWSFDNINDHEYTNILNNKTKWCEDIDLALKITEKFIIQNGLILVGGQAIQYALLMKGHKGIYPDDEWPDLDCIGENHQKYAFMLAEILCKEKIPHIVAIPAMHIQTMKTRIYQAQDAMDLSYTPKKVFKIINESALTYKNNLKIIHPHFQMIDQHRSLSLPFENEPRYTMDFRWIKDMKRYDILYDKYPIKSKPIAKVIKNFSDVSFMINTSVCYSGITGLAYWLSKAGEMKLITDINLKFKINKGIITYNTPIEHNIITMFDDDINKTLDFLKKGAAELNPHNYLMDTIITSQEMVWAEDWANNWTDNEIIYGSGILKKIKTKEINIKYYATLLGKMPRRAMVNKHYEIYDNLGQQLSCHNDGDLCIANLQNIMLYLLERYMFHEIYGINKQNANIYSALYLQCFSIVSQAALIYSKGNKAYNIFLPIGLSENTERLTVYGKENCTEGKHFSKTSLKFKLGIGTSTKGLRPRSSYPTLIEQCKTDATFDPDTSYLFDIGGDETTPF